MLVFHYWVEPPIFKAINANFVSFIYNIKSCFHVINLNSVSVCDTSDIHKLNSKKGFQHNLRCENREQFTSELEYDNLDSSKIHLLKLFFL